MATLGAAKARAAPWWPEGIRKLSLLDLDRTIEGAAISLLAFRRGVTVPRSSPFLDVSAAFSVALSLVSSDGLFCGTAAGFDGNATGGRIWPPEAWLPFAAACFSGLVSALGSTAGLFPAALALSGGSSSSSSLMVADELEPSSDLGVALFPLCSEILGIGLGGPMYFDPVELPSREPTSVVELVDDCELGRRGRAGRLLDAVVDATNFFEAAGFLSVFAGDVDFVEDRTSGFFIVKPPDGTSSSAFPSPSPSDPWGDTNRAVGRGPEFDGPLGFFKIGCDGGGLDEEGVKLFDDCEMLDIAGFCGISLGCSCDLVSSCRLVLIRDFPFRSSCCRFSRGSGFCVAGLLACDVLSDSCWL